MRSLVDAGLWHGGKPVWCNYRESFQLHWGNLPVICQWLRYSITSKPCTSAPGHKIKPKRTPHAIVTTLIVTTISFREEDAGLNSARMFILIPQHMKTSELLFIFTVKRLTSTFCPALKWQGYNLFVWGTSDQTGPFRVPHTTSFPRSGGFLI